jgi:hypothetical protein
MRPSRSRHAPISSSVYTKLRYSLRHFLRTARRVERSVTKSTWIASEELHLHATIRD